MAESYVTKFTKYVAEQRDKLAKKLSEKGIVSTGNLSLGSLVSQLDILRDDYTVAKHDRDPNLPDIDEMFNNDSLRAVNGGQYKASYYALMEVDMNGVVGLLYQAPSSTYHTMLSHAEKVVFSDGAEYSTQSANILHTMNESGIYTTTDGVRYALVMFYATEPVVVTFYQYAEPFVEIIDDFYIGSYRYNPQPDVSGYLISRSYNTNYFRYVGSNNTVENIYTANIKWNFQYLQYAKTVIFEGVYRIVTLNLFYNISKLIFGGTMYGSSSTSTSVSISIGSTSSMSYSLKYRTISLPISDLPMSISMGYTGVENLIIPETEISSFNSTETTNLIEDIHIGSKCYASPFGTNKTFYALRNITVSKNAFGLNESAITIDLAKAYQLTYESLMNMINNFADRTGKTANILKLSTISKNKLTDEEKAILTSKNWTIS